MNNPIINERICRGAYLQYLNLVEVLAETIKTLSKYNGYTDYLRIVQDLLDNYNPDLTLGEQKEKIQKILKKWIS